MEKQPKESKRLYVFAILMLVVGIQVALAQAPPPPGVPIDGGISAVVALCIGYGAYRKRNN